MTGKKTDLYMTGTNEALLLSCGNVVFLATWKRD